MRYPVPAVFVIGLACAAAPAVELTVNSAAELTTALATADPDDTIVLTPVGSPYVGNFQTPFNSRLSLRGSTGDPADVVLDGGGVGRTLWYQTIGSSSDPDAVIAVEHLTFRNGVTAMQAIGFGYAGTFLVSNCVFEDHTGDATSLPFVLNHFGNGTNGGPTVFDNCVFRRNVIPPGSSSTSPKANGGVFVGCAFEDNRLEAPNGLGGGAVGEAGYFEDCVFERNFSVLNGGAVRGAGVGFVRCEFIDNASDAEGGAVYGAGFDRIEGCVFTDNTAARGGALAGSMPERVKQNLFVRNTASVEGGAIYISGGSAASVQQNTFAGNDAPLGSTLRNASSEIDFYNNIVWNAAGEASAPISGPATARFNVSSADLPGATEINADPLFVDPAGGDYRVGPGSPAIDAGSVLQRESDFDSLGLAAASALLTFDANGDPRVVDDPATPDTGLLGAAGPMDIGAYEYQAPPACDADVNTTNTNPGDPGFGAPDGTVNGADLSYYVERWLAGCP